MAEAANRSKKIFFHWVWAHGNGRRCKSDVIVANVRFVAFKSEDGSKWIECLFNYATNALCAGMKITICIYLCDWNWTNVTRSVWRSRSHVSNTRCQKYGERVECTRTTGRHKCNWHRLRPQFNIQRSRNARIFWYDSHNVRVDLNAGSTFSFTTTTALRKSHRRRRRATPN